MHKKEKIIQAIVQQGILPLYFHADEELSIQVLETLYTSGIRVIEYTNRGKGALKNFRSLIKTCYKKFPDLILGLGTVMDEETAWKAIKFGAEFLVSPGYSKALDKLAQSENILWIPGCMTPTDLMQAQESGISLIKLFPASAIGPSFLKSVKELFPELLFMPTGGVHKENLHDWFSAGASAVAVGSSLISPFVLDNKEFKFLQTDVKAMLEEVAAIRRK